MAVRDPEIVEQADETFRHRIPRIVPCGAEHRLPKIPRDTGPQRFGRRPEFFLSPGAKRPDQAGLFAESFRDPDFPAPPGPPLLEKDARHPGDHREEQKGDHEERRYAHPSP